MLDIGQESAALSVFAGFDMSAGSVWIYILGARSGADIKIGRTGADRVATRLKGVNAEQTTDETYLVLAAVRGSAQCENHLKETFRHCLRTDKGRKQEYFWPTDELVEYAAWLRHQWYVSPDGTSLFDEYPLQDFSHWEPSHDRRVRKPIVDPTVLVQNYETQGGPLTGTPWAWLPNPKATVQDYFTPPEIVNAAREAMGDIDLDAASHWLAQREHRIPDYFDVNRSAFENDWYGRVWLNPPYGNNGPWFDRILKYVDSGAVSQICILSPVWAFTTVQAKDLMQRVSGSVILTPTPKFWGNAEGRTGKNHPHGVMYIGGRTTEFLQAFSEFGIPVEIKWDAVRLKDELEAAG